MRKFSGIYVKYVARAGREIRTTPLYPLARTKPCLELTTYRCNRLQGFEIVFFSLLILFLENVFLENILLVALAVSFDKYDLVVIGRH